MPHDGPPVFVIQGAGDFTNGFILTVDGQLERPHARSPALAAEAITQGIGPWSDLAA